MLRNLGYLLLLAFTGNSDAMQCNSDGIALQVLGSGGPIADDTRASTSYLIWQNGRARVLVDIGGGSILRLAESGARIETLDAVAITHTHVDHIGDFPALIKSGFFSQRQRPLALLGPDGSRLFPSINQYFKNTFLSEDASHRYLAWVSDGSNGKFAINVTEIPRREYAKSWFKSMDLEISAVGVEHSIVPAIGYVAVIGNRRIAIPGDMSADNPRFIELAKGSDLLVLHLAIPETASDRLARLHARPSEIGLLAASIQPKQLVLSHVMRRAERQLERHLQLIRQAYKGPVNIATDLACYPLNVKH